MSEKGLSDARIAEISLATYYTDVRPISYRDVRELLDEIARLRAELAHVTGGAA